MLVSLNPGVVYVLFGVYVVAGLLAYEQWGVRMGGVLAMPYLVVYALSDLTVLLLFALATVTAYVAGEAVHRRTLIYGRRMLVAFLLVSLMASFAFNAVLDVSISGVFLPILPGLFAYNLHREGRPAWHSGVFTAAVLAGLVFAFAVRAIVGGATQPAEPPPAVGLAAIGVR